MWIFLPIGFFSIVRIHGSERFAVRARRRMHLERLLRDVPGLNRVVISESEKTDYRHRVIVAAPAVKAILDFAREAISYTNFKSEAERVNGHDIYVEALHDVWGTMYRTQPRKPIVLPKRHRPRRKAPARPLPDDFDGMDGRPESCW